MEYNVIPINQLTAITENQLIDIALNSAKTYLVPISIYDTSKQQDQQDNQIKSITLEQLKETINESVVIPFVDYGYDENQEYYESNGLMLVQDKKKLDQMPLNIKDGSSTGSLYTIGAKPTLGNYAFAEGRRTQASGEGSHAQGMYTVASGEGSHAEGYSNNDIVLASGYAAHAEGCDTTASGDYSHVEGHGSVASSYGSHAEGTQNHATGSDSHAEGNLTTASGDNSHAEGYYTIASGDNSHAGGYNTTAASDNQTVIGKYNIIDDNNNYALIIGNGTANNSKSNAGTLDWQGNLKLAGNVYINNSTSEANKLITQSSLTQVYNLIYPIGSVYCTIDENIDPQTLFGGSWELINTDNNDIIYWKRVEEN